MARKPASTHYRNELRNNILTEAYALFLKNGIRAVKMDDIAHHLGISKRTLYEIYSNKEDVVLESFKQHTETSKRNLSARISHTDDAMDILTEFFRIRFNEINEMSSSFFDDIQMYPRVLEFFEQNRNEHKEQAYEFFLKGQEQGYFIGGLKFDIINDISNNITENFLMKYINKPYPLKDVLQVMMIFFVRSICTIKGIERLDKTVLSDNQRQ